MKITSKKFLVGIAAVCVAVLVPATSYATHVFRDVPHDRFFSEPVEWAWNNGLTTGSPPGSGNFLPFENVTRAENITFNFRYDEQVVQPALGDIRSDVSSAEAAIASRYTKAQTDAAIAAATPQLVSVSRDGDEATVSQSWSDIPGMSATFTVPAGTTEVAVVTFSSENMCQQDPNLSVFCYVRVALDGTAQAGSETVFNSVRQGANSADVFGHASHSMQWVSGPLSPGSHTITPQFRVDESNAFFFLRDPTMTVLRMSAANAETFSSQAEAEATSGYPAADQGK